jgi:hypothetical protein
MIMKWGYLRNKDAGPKYKNEKVDGLCGYGFSHRSKLERAVCDMIWFREKVGELQCLAHEETHYLSKARYRYVADFKVQNVETKEVYWIEAKGASDGRWPTTKKMWKAYGPGRLEIYMGDYRKPLLAKVIVPDESAE